MVWDKGLPLGSKNIALGDNDIRDNNDQLETALDLEHDFTTGAGQTGRHHFPVGTAAAVGAISSGVALGSIAFANDVRTGEHVLYFYNGSAWVAADCGVTTLPRLDEQSVYTTTQWADLEDISGTFEVVASTPDELTIDLNRSSHRYYTMTGATEFSGFTNDNAGNSTTVTVELIQPTPAVAVTFASGIFESAYGVAPVIGLGDGEKTVLQFIKQSTNKWLVVTSPSVVGI